MIAAPLEPNTTMTTNKNNAAHKEYHFFRVYNDTAGNKSPYDKLILYVVITNSPLKKLIT